MKFLNQVTQGDCLELMAQLPDASVDMVLTSPPYDNLRTYKGFSFDFEGVARELLRVVKPGGVVVWVVADATVDGSETGTSFRQALFFKEIGFRLHDTQIYQKINYVPLTHRRYEQSFEYMFCLSKGKPKVFNPVKVQCRTPGGKSGKFFKTPDAETTSPAHSETRTGVEKISPNIFGYTVGNEKTGHPAVFPLPLAVDQISSWSNCGDTVLDPFSGSGTTGVAARNIGRQFIQFELSPEYCEIARRRLAENEMSEPLFLAMQA